MRIAVVDVAAEIGGAMSVLLDFVNYIQSEQPFCAENEWFVYTSTKIDIKDKSNINSIVVPEIKKSWFHRLYWERFTAIKDFKDRKIDIVISLQNTAFKKGSYKQITYFHNVLLLEDSHKYSLFKAEERKYSVYTKLIAPYTLRSLEGADYVIAQTNTVKNNLLKYNNDLEIIVVRPNVYIDSSYKNIFRGPLKGIVYPTSAVPFKRIEELVTCVSENYKWFVDNNLDVLVTISGKENEYTRNVIRMADGMQDVIHFIGFQERGDLLKLYNDHALFICSELESFPLPFCEAAYAGAPIVAARYPYSEEATEGNENAYLYKPGNTSEMMDCFIKLISNKATSFNGIEYVDNSWKSIEKLIAGRCEFE